MAEDTSYTRANAGSEGNDTPYAETSHNNISGVLNTSNVSKTSRSSQLSDRMMRMKPIDVKRKKRKISKSFQASRKYSYNILFK